MIVLLFSMQGEDVIEHISGKGHVFTFFVREREIILSILMSSIICVQFSQLVYHCVDLIILLNVLMPRY